jgi:hypothetical protein
MSVVTGACRNANLLAVFRHPPRSGSSHYISKIPIGLFSYQYELCLAHHPPPEWQCDNHNFHPFLSSLTLAILWFSRISSASQDHLALYS